MNIGRHLFNGNRVSNLKEPLKVSSINLLRSNGEFGLVAAEIKKETPDLLVLLEVTTLWEIALDSILKEYKQKLVIPRDDSFGIGVWSKVELTELKKVELSEVGLPSILAKLTLGEKKITLLATHPPPPVDAYQFQLRNNHFKRIQEIKDQLGESLILIGDLNSTTYSPHLKKMISALNLQDSRNQFGIFPSWPLWFPPAMIAIDHCFVSRDLKIQSRTTGSDIHSDHLPIHLQLGLR